MQDIVRPSALIVACDGMYMGRQTVTRLGEQNRRIGYRHLGRPVTANVNGTNMTFDKTVTNTVFADGHAEPIHNDSFPHGNVVAENSGRFSLLANQ
jgi:prepilin-type processing-associated H-X9-DG protein